jgi:uncharacterized protein
MTLKGYHLIMLGKFAIVLGLISLSGCSVQPRQVSLSSGTVGGYYNRLGQQLSESVKSTVDIQVRNAPSRGSQQNLQRLVERQTDFALIQLDVASEAMRQGKVKAIAILANEYVHVITQANSGVRSLSDLQGKRVAVGVPGSGIHFTANQLLQADGLEVKKDESNLDRALEKLKNRQVDAVFYVGSLGANTTLKQQLRNNPSLRFVPMQSELTNLLTLQQPGSYQAATLLAGSYASRPAVPAQDTPTLSTATVLVTHPGVDRKTVGLVTWSVLSTAREFAPFYPELQSEETEPLLKKGLVYLAAGAQEVYEQGDPRDALIRYWENNNDLQAGVFIVLTTTTAGLLLRYWRRERSKKLVTVTAQRVNDLKKLLPDHAQQALEGIEELRQEHRLSFIDGAMTTEVYAELQQRTQTFSDQCRTLLDQQRQRFILDTLLLLDDWQAALQSDSETALTKLSQIKHRCREMLLTGQVNIEAYIELMELTLMSVMAGNPQHSKETTSKEIASNETTPIH